MNDPLIIPESARVTKAKAYAAKLESDYADPKDIRDAYKYVEQLEALDALEAQ